MAMGDWTGVSVSTCLREEPVYARPRAQAQGEFLGLRHPQSIMPPGSRNTVRDNRFVPAAVKRAPIHLRTSGPDARLGLRTPHRRRAHQATGTTHLRLTTTSPLTELIDREGPPSPLLSRYPSFVLRLTKSGGTDLM